MSGTNIESNKALVEAWVRAFNAHDAKAIGDLLHRDFVWNTAVQADDGPNELRPLESKLLSGRNLALPKPRLNRQETITAYTNVFGGLVGKLEANSVSASKGSNDNFMRLEIQGMTAEGNRVALEAQSVGLVHPVTGRRYQNFYHLLYKIEDGKIILLKEYQDTLRLFDFLME